MTDHAPTATPPKTMREQMALAIGKVEFAYCNPKDTPNTWKHALAMADAALDCLTRPPAHTMIVAGLQAMDTTIGIIPAADRHPGNHTPLRGMTRAWEAMVRTMIEEGRRT